MLLRSLRKAVLSARPAEGRYMVRVDHEATIRFLSSVFEPTDWVAILLKSNDRSCVAQRVGPVSWIQSERFQRWLRAMNAQKSQGTSARSIQTTSAISALATAR